MEKIASDQKYDIPVGTSQVFLINTMLRITCEEWKQMMFKLQFPVKTYKVRIEQNRESFYCTTENPF